MDNTDVILSARELRQRIKNEDEDRTAELEEAASLVLNTKVAQYIRRHSHEINAERPPMKRYDLYSTDVSNVCSSASREVCIPISSDEFNFIVETLVKQLEALGYLAVIEERAGNYAQMAISSSDRT